MLSLKESSASVSLTTLFLMLTIVFLSLYEAGFDNNVVHWIVIPLGVYAAALIIKNKVNVDLSIDSPLFWYGLFLLWAGISIFWSINPHRTLVEFIQLSLYGLVFMLATTINEDNIMRLGRIALITAAGVALFGISQYLFLSSSRIESTLANSNAMGIYMVMLFLSVWGYNIRKPNRYISLACIIILISLVLTMSRGSFICLGISIPFIFIGLSKQQIKMAFLRTTICLFFALAFSQLIVLIAPYLQEVVSENLVLSHVLTRRSAFIAWSGVSRFAFWQTGIRVFFGNIFNGTGLGTFFLAYYTEFVDNIWYSRFVHNHYIQTMAEIGIIGIGLLLAFIYRIAILIWAKFKNKSYPIFFAGMIASAIAFLIHIGGDFSWNFPGIAVIFFITTGFITSRSAANEKSYFKKTNIMVVLAIAMIIIVILSAWQLTANLLYKKGIILESEDKIDDAAQIYDYANQIYPLNSMAYSFASKAYYQMALEQEAPELIEEAIVRAERAVALSPVDGNLHNLLGRLYWENGSIQKAEYHLNQAALYSAYRIRFFIDLGWFYIQQGRYEEAQQAIERGLELKDFAVGMHPSDADREMVSDQILVLNQLKEIIDSEKENIE